MSEKKSFHFEKALQELQTLVERMERGELNLEQSLTEFEGGIKLIKQCQQALEAAEQKVQILLDKNKQPQPFSVEDAQ